MNRKQFVILIVLLLVLGAAGLIVQRGREQAANSGGAGSGKKLLGDKFPINEVARITIQEGTNQLNLAKKNDVWRVTERSDYPANFDMITEFVRKAADLKVVQTEEVGASQLGRLELAPGQGTNSGALLEFKDKDGKTIKAVTLGKLHVRRAAKPSPYGDESYPDGRYVLVAGDTQKVLVIADPLTGATAKPGQWLKKDFFKVERPRSVAVTWPAAAATNSWKLARATETNEWTLADAKPDENADTNKFAALTSPFAAPSFNDVLAQTAKPEESGLDQPTMVTVETFDDFIYTVKVGKKSGEDYPMTLAVAATLPRERIVPADEKPEDKEKAEKAWKDHQKQLEDKLKQAKTFENWTYLVSVWSLDPVLKERKDLMAEKKEEPKPEDKAEPAAEKKDESKPAAAAGTDGEKKE